MSEEKRRILDMVEQGTITQEDAARLLEALGENEPAPAQPQESQPPQDGTWEAEHQGDEDCQGPNQRVEIHLEGEGAKSIYQDFLLFVVHFSFSPFQKPYSWGGATCSSMAPLTVSSRRLAPPLP